MNTIQNRLHLEQNPKPTTNAVGVANEANRHLEKQIDINPPYQNCG
jgi:hypothetical protein